MPDPASVIVVDDHPIFRGGLLQTLELDGDLSVVAEGSSAAEAIRLAAQYQPDLMLLDVAMSDSGIDAIGAICAASPQTLVVMLTASEHEDDVARALSAGAAGYVLKGTTANQLLAIIGDIRQGNAHVSLRAMSRLAASQGRAAPASDPALASLSPQEARVLRLVAQGMNNREIGQQLKVQEKTVKFHLSNVFSKLGVRNRVEASLKARRGWPDLL